MSGRLAAAAVAVLYILTGCKSGGVTYNEYVSPSWQISEVSGGNMTTVIYGNPFNIPKSRFDAAVTSEMNGKNFGPKVRFTPAQSRDTGRGYRVVLLFGSQGAVSRSQACGDLSRFARGAPTGGGFIRLQAAYCIDEEARTTITGEVPDATGPDDPGFRNMVASVTRGLFPAFSPDMRGGRNFGL